MFHLVQSGWALCLVMILLLTTPRSLRFVPGRLDGDNIPTNTRNAALSK